MVGQFGDRRKWYFGKCKNKTRGNPATGGGGTAKGQDSCVGFMRQDKSSKHRSPCRRTSPPWDLLVTQSDNRINAHGFPRRNPASRNRDRSQDSCQTGKRRRIRCTYAMEQPRHQAGKSKCGP